MAIAIILAGFVVGLVKRDRRWFRTGMAGFLYHRAKASLMPVAICL
ncbi:MAG: DUF4400 domain-containing protein [Gibbsiella quercinecans]